MKKLLLEAVLVAMTGAVLAFAANALSPRGLQLSRNYFPRADVAASTAPGSTHSPGATVAGTNSPLETLAARLEANRLQLARSNEVIAWFHDPRRAQDGVIFIDARDEEHYRAGHIPGAYLFDRFRAENYLTNVLQVCLVAQQIVFYCNGGDCDDSEHAAIMLRDSLSLSPDKVFVYGGGITEWVSLGLPVELAGRNSGQLTNRTGAAGPAHPAPAEVKP